MKIKMFLATLMLVNVLSAQYSIKKSGDLSDMKKKKTYLIIDRESEFDLKLEREVKKNWKLSEFEIVDAKDFKETKKKADKKNSTILLSTTIRIQFSGNTFVVPTVSWLDGFKIANNSMNGAYIPLRLQESMVRYSGYSDDEWEDIAGCINESTSEEVAIYVNQLQSLVKSYIEGNIKKPKHYFSSVTTKESVQKMHESTLYIIKEDVLTLKDKKVTINENFFKTTYKHDVELVSYKEYQSMLEDGEDFNFLRMTKEGSFMTFTVTNSISKEFIFAYLSTTLNCGKYKSVFANGIHELNNPDIKD